MLTLYSTKAILCKGEENFIVPCHQITSAPEWVEKTDGFKMGIDDGCLTVTDTKETQVAAENGDLDNGDGKKDLTEDLEKDAAEKEKLEKAENEKDAKKNTKQ